MLKKMVIMELRKLAEIRNNEFHKHDGNLCPLYIAKCKALGSQ